MGCCGSSFDYNIVKAFLKKISPYSIGMSVKLSDGRTGIVIKENLNNPLRPSLKLVNEKNKILDLYEDLSLNNITISDINYNYLTNIKK